ncbi:MAG: ABC transporter permease subunit [Spirochaetota bacterium]
MKTLFLKEFKLSLKGLLIWSAVVIVTAVYAAVEYPLIAENMDTITQGFEMIPKVVRIMFGVNAVPIDTPLGMYVCMYYWYCLITFTHAAFIGVLFVTRDEQNRTSEFLYSRPYPRKTVIQAKMLNALVNIGIIAIVTWLITVVSLLPVLAGPSIAGIVAYTMFGMFLTQMVFMGIGLLCSAIFRNNRTALAVSVSFMLATFSVAIAIEYFGDLPVFDFLSPFRFFNAPSVAERGIRPIYVLIVVLMTLISAYGTPRMYERRDLPA